jgi:hypothetical protein
MEIVPLNSKYINTYTKATRVTRLRLLMKLITKYIWLQYEFNKI